MCSTDSNILHVQNGRQSVVSELRLAMMSNPGMKPEEIWTLLDAISADIETNLSQIEPVRG